MNELVDLEKTNDSELLMLYREDDEDAKNMLFYKYKFIIDILLKKYQHWLSALKIDYQELYSECTVGFSDALYSFQEDKDSSLPTFITLCVERRLNGVIRKYSRDKYKIMQDSYSLDFIYDDSNGSLIETLSDENNTDPLKNMAEQEEYDELIKEIKTILTNKEYEVFVLKSRGFDYQEIAHILNKNPKQIDNTIQRIKTKIKNILTRRK